MLATEEGIRERTSDSESHGIKICRVNVLGGEHLEILPYWSKQRGN